MKRETIICILIAALSLVVVIAAGWAGVTYGELSSVGDPGGCVRATDDALGLYGTASMWQATHDLCVSLNS